MSICRCFTPLCRYSQCRSCHDCCNLHRIRTGTALRSSGGKKRGRAGSMLHESVLRSQIYRLYGKSVKSTSSLPILAPVRVSCLLAGFVSGNISHLHTAQKRCCIQRITKANMDNELQNISTLKKARKKKKHPQSGLHFKLISDCRKREKKHTND